MFLAVTFTNFVPLKIKNIIKKFFIMKYYTVKITYCETTTQTVVAGGNSIEDIIRYFENEKMKHPKEMSHLQVRRDPNGTDATFWGNLRYMSVLSQQQIYFISEINIIENPNAFIDCTI